MTEMKYTEQNFEEHIEEHLLASGFCVKGSKTVASDFDLPSSNLQAG